jgi:hypothetical protein
MDVFGEPLVPDFTVGGFTGIVVLSSQTFLVSEAMKTMPNDC